MSAITELCTTWADVEMRIIARLRSLEPVIQSEHIDTMLPCSTPLGQLYRHALAAPVHARAATNPDSVLNTLRYLFWHMRCGILVSIRKGRVAMFAPFANAAYTNTWHDRLTFSHGSVSNYVRAKALTTRQPVEEWLPFHQWWMNGGILCNVMPPGVWGNAHCAELLDMLDAACVTVAQPDCDFFINKRDRSVQRVRTSGFILRRHRICRLCHAPDRRLETMHRST